MSEQPKCGHLMIDHGWTCQKPKGKGATEQREALHNAKERKDLAVLEARIAEAMWWYSHSPSATGEDRIAELQKQKAAIGKA